MVNRKTGQVLLTLLAVAACTLCFGAITSATSGISISPGLIRAEAPVYPGEIHALPVHTVMNLGSTAYDVTVEVADREHNARRLVPREWFAVEPGTLMVEPNSSDTVQITMVVPEDAEAGEYAVWFVFKAAPREGAGMVVGTAAGVGLAFEIKMPGGGAEEETEPEATPDSADEESLEEESVDELEAIGVDGEGMEKVSPETQAEETTPEEADLEEQEVATALGANHPRTEDVPLLWFGAGVLLVALGFGGHLVWRRLSSED